MAAMEDEEWDWLMYHLHKWSQEEWEAWLPTQSEATHAYYHSWNRRQNDVLLRQQQQQQQMSQATAARVIPDEPNEAGGAGSMASKDPWRPCGFRGAGPHGCHLVGHPLHKKTLPAPTLW